MLGSFFDSRKSPLRRILAMVFVARLILVAVTFLLIGGVKPAGVRSQYRSAPHSVERLIAAEEEIALPSPILSGRRW